MSEARPLVDASLELAEVGFDQFLKSEVAKDIPIVGTAIKLCSAASSIRNPTFEVSDLGHRLIYAYHDTKKNYG